MNKKIALFVVSLFFISCTSCVSFPWASSDHTYPTESFVKMQTYLDDQQVTSGSGSVIQQTKRGTIVLTAGHICVNPRLDLISTVEGKEISLKAHGQDTEIITADIDIDVCLVKVEKGLRSVSPLAISHDGPKMQEAHFTVSSPAGVADTDTGLVGMFEGLFIGDTEILDLERSVFSIPSTGGSSGAPIVNENNAIVSITTHGDQRFEHMTIGPKWDDFYAFVAEAMIPYSEEFTKEEHIQD